MQVRCFTHPEIRSNPYTVEFSVTDGGAMIQNANIVQTDISASNGVIHVIDTVIMPAKN